MKYGLNIKLARESRGISQKELAKLVEISQVSLSRIEKSDAVVAFPLLEKMGRALHYPVSFFDKDFKESEFEFSMFYRKRASMKVKDLDIIKRRILFINKAVDILLESVDIPELSIPHIECTDEYQADEIAYRLKRHLQIPNYPIEKLVNVIEHCGAIVYFIDFGDSGEKFDGLTTFTPNNHPIIYINDRMPNDRKRFNLVHELGHLTMHSRSTNIQKSGDEMEREANLFAAEFLLPRENCISDLCNLKYKDLPALKQKYLVSKAFIIHRASELECITESTAKYFYITLVRNKEKKEEMGFVPIDRPSIISKMIGMHVNGLGYSYEELSDILGLYPDEIRELYGSKMNIAI